MSIIVSPTMNIKRKETTTNLLAAAAGAGAGRRRPRRMCITVLILLASSVALVRRALRVIAVGKSAATDAQEKRSQQRPLLLGWTAHHLRTDRPFVPWSPPPSSGNSSGSIASSSAAAAVVSGPRPFKPVLPESRLSGTCSCRNPSAQFECCQRVVFRRHKMGHVLTNDLLVDFEPQIQLAPPRDPDEPSNIDFYPGTVDYRNVVLWRDIYSSLASGYLYHKSGRECWLDHEGNPTSRPDRWMDWDRHVASYELNPPKSGRSLCRYLADEPEEVGMRAYVEWIFHRSYKAVLDKYAAAVQVDQARERVLVVRYEDLASPVTRPAAVARVLDFLYNGTDHKAYQDRTAAAAATLAAESSAAATGTAPSRRRLKEAEWQKAKEEAKEKEGEGGDGHHYEGGHATSHDPALRSRLKEIIRRLDAEHYNGEIAWVDSAVVPT